MSTTCKECNRAVWKEHVDAEGNCVLCAKPPQADQPSPSQPKK